MIGKISPSGTTEIIARLDPITIGGPNGGVVMDAQGALYGVTSSGGANNEGTAYCVTPTGSVLDLFDFGGSNGIQPIGELVLETDGSLYGVTSGGPGKGSWGVIFRLVPGNTCH